MLSPDDIPGGKSTVALSYPDVDRRSCQLLGPTALVVQGLLGIFVILSLVYKRHRETPKRPWRIWLFDVSKQVVGQMFVHGANLLVAGLVSHSTAGNACVSYFLNILIDTTFGVALIYVALHAFTRLFTETLKMEGFESGIYGTPPSITYWARQAAVYVLALSTMKVIVITILVLFPGIYLAGEWLLSWTRTGTGDALEVIFTMGLFPILINILQFWLIDSIVKASSAPPLALDIENDASEVREPLFGVPSDDEDDHHLQRNRAGALHPPHLISSMESRALDSHDGKSFGTSFTAFEEQKSNASSSQQPIDEHAYPPSLSSSISSLGPFVHEAKVPRSAKNLMKKVQKKENPTPRSRPSRPTPASPRSSRTPGILPRTPSPHFKSTADIVMEDRSKWGDSWDDENDWADGEDDIQMAAKPSLDSVSKDPPWTTASSSVQGTR